MEPTLFLIFLLFASGLPNFLCAIFLVTPLAKHFILRKSLFTAAILPTLGSIGADAFLPPQIEQFAIVLSFSITSIIIAIAIFMFIRRRKHWTHYLLLIILIFGSLWASSWSNIDMSGGI